jgi:hypothetical protein
MIFIWCVKILFYIIAIQALTVINTIQYRNSFFKENESETSEINRLLK